MTTFSSPLRGGAVLKLLVGCRDTVLPLYEGRLLKDDVEAAGCWGLAARRITLNDVPPLLALPTNIHSIHFN